MAKFKKGDKIIIVREWLKGDKNSSFSDESGKEGIFVRMTRESDDVDVGYKYVVNVGDYRELIVAEIKLKETIKLEKIAAKKATNNFELKDGQYFTATWNRKKVRGVVKEMCGDFMLRGKDFYDEPDDVEEAEFPTELFIDMYNYSEEKTHTHLLKDAGVTNFVVLTDKRQKAIIDGDKAITVNGHVVHIRGNDVEFGCGAVSATKKEIKDFYSVYKDVDTSDLESYNDITERFSKEELEAAINHYNYLQMQTPALIKAFNNIVKQMRDEYVNLDDLDKDEVKKLMKKLDD